VSACLGYIVRYIDVEVSFWAICTRDNPENGFVTPH
jgi:hypothetical protein